MGVNHLPKLSVIHLPKLGVNRCRSWCDFALKSGVVLDGQLFPTDEGVPQGGTVSPLLALVALHGLETAIRGCVKQSKNAQSELCVCFYADDFVRHEARIMHGARAPAARRRVASLSP